MNSKGTSYFVLFLAIGTTLVLLTAYVELKTMFDDAEKSNQEEHIGGLAIDVRSSDIEVMKTQKLQKAVVREQFMTKLQVLALSGFYDQSPCGSFNGLTTWDEGCFPTGKEFGTIVDKLAVQSPIPYEFSLAKDDSLYIAGIALMPQIVPIECPGRCGEYIKYPSFSVRIPYDYNEFETVVSQARSLSKVCSDIECVNQAVLDFQKQTSMKWDVGCNGNSGSKVTFCVTGQIEYDFALDLVEHVDLEIKKMQFDGFPSDGDPTREGTVAVSEFVNFYAKVTGSDELYGELCMNLGCLGLAPRRSGDKIEFYQTIPIETTTDAFLRLKDKGAVKTSAVFQLVRD